MLDDSDRHLLEFATAASALTVKAAADHAAAAQKAAEVAALVPAAVDALVANGYAPESGRRKLAADLSDPVRALEVIVQMTEMAGAIGTEPLGVPSKQASAYDSLRSPFAGGRVDRGMRESDKAFLRHYPESR